MKMAALTMSYNESFFLPLWLEYYGKAFGTDNLFVIDHGSDDGSLKGIEANILTVPRIEFDEEIRSQLIANLYQILLKSYDFVIFSDCDEFLVPDPELYSGLQNFISIRCNPYITAIGLNVLHCIEEKSIITGQPILRQRNVVNFRSGYCKTLVFATPIQWSAGFHSCNKIPNFDALYLFHLKYMDRSTFKRSHARLQNIRWSQASIEKGLGKHWRYDASRSASFFNESLYSSEIVTDNEFSFQKDIVQCGIGLTTEPVFWTGSLARIPERFRDCIPAVRTLAEPVKD